MWLPRVEYDRLVQQLESAQLALEVERAENRRTERWMCNMLLRRAGTFPVPPVASVSPAPPTTAPTETPPPIDPGELAAMVEVGKEYGVPAEDVERLLRRERGID